METQDLDLRLEKTIWRKNSHLKSLTLLPLWVASFLWGFLPDSTRIEPFSVPQLSTAIIKCQGWTLNSHVPIKLSQIFLVKMLPRLKLHRRIQGQRFFFHLNPLAPQSKPCQRRQSDVSVPNQKTKQWKTPSGTLKTTRRPLGVSWLPRQGRQTKTRGGTEPQFAIETFPLPPRVPSADGIVSSGQSKTLSLVYPKFDRKFFSLTVQQLESQEDFP